jgi:4-amino-4-deoxy-L-arabinose transferase-like glycosyltransferase
VAVVSPAAWAVTPALAAVNATIPVAGPSLLSQNGGGQMGGPMGGTSDSTLIAYLEANQGDYYYLVAESSANQVSTIALETGKPVLAWGGFTGSDPALTVTKLEQMIADKLVRYVVIGGQGGPGGSSSSSITSWVQSNCTAVSYTSSTTTGNGGNSSNLYVCSAQ